MFGPYLGQRYSGCGSDRDKTLSSKGLTALAAAPTFRETRRNHVHPDRADAQSRDAQIPARPRRDGGGHGAISPSAEECDRSPLAQRLFAVDGVTGVFLGADFVSVSKDDALDWYRLKPAVLGAIMEHFTPGEPVFLARRDRAAEEDAEDDDEIVTADQGTAGDPRASGGGAGRRRHHLPPLRGRRRLSAHAGLVLGLPELDRDLEGGHREHAAPLRARKSSRSAPSSSRHHRPRQIGVG